MVGKGEAVDDANEEGGFTTDPNGKAVEAAPGVVDGPENIEICLTREIAASQKFTFILLSTAQNVFSFKNQERQKTNIITVYFHQKIQFASLGK